MDLPTMYTFYRLILRSILRTFSKNSIELDFIQSEVS